MEKKTQKFGRTVLPLMFALLVISGLIFHAHLAEAQVPSVENGVLDLAEWNGEKAFKINGEWEFYWDTLLTEQEIGTGRFTPLLVTAPNEWSDYKINGTSLPGKGKATYRIHVTGVEAGTRYGVRIQDMATIYRLYIDNVLAVQNGIFGNNETATVSVYLPRITEITPDDGSFDLILQIENDAYAAGGMRDPVLFGTYEQVSAFDRLLSNTGAAAAAVLIVACLFFLVFFMVHRGEKDLLILSGVGVLILFRFLTTGDVVLAVAFSEMSISAMVRILFLATFWTQFLLYYFIYYVYGNLIRKWQVVSLLVYTIGVSLFTLLFPFYIVTSAYKLMNFVLLIVISAIIAQLTRAAWQGREGASLLLGASWLILFMIFYELFAPDRSAINSLLLNLHMEYMVFVLAQVAVVAQRYRRAQELEIAHLKGQIRPHFIHNSLTSIISISRTDPDRARELLVDFSSYLRGFYDYDRDEMVTFQEELELVRAYTSLEQARFGEKFRVTYDVEAEDFLLPSLMLQPLVENAFIHGLREKDEGGTITVFAKGMKNNRVRIGVRDDGVGFKINSDPARRGVGIENINRRLSRIYRTSLVYSTPEGGGCEVYLEIPCKEAVNNENMAD